MVDADQIVSEEYTTYFRSTIAFGNARIVDGEEWFDAFKALAEKYASDLPEASQIKEIKSCTQSYIIAIDIDQIIGKEAIELVKEKNK